MNAWRHTLLSGIYTYSNLHCGTGQASGAIDLPIAREVTTGHPVLPATSLKGVAREGLETFDDNKNEPKLDKKIINYLFGEEVERAEDQAESDRKESANGKYPAGALCFTEGRLLAYPARSLNRPFVHLTSPLLLERFKREVKLFGLEKAFNLPETIPGVGNAAALVTDDQLGGKTMVIEDLLVAPDKVAYRQELVGWATILSMLIDDGDAAKRFQSGLVLLPDDDFAELIERIVPVRARTKLTGGKTTDKWDNPDTGKTEFGNLWYEEHIPSDCLFACFVGERNQRAFNSIDGNTTNTNSAMEIFRQHTSKLGVIQLGGNETVGNGLCGWHFLRDL